MQKRNIYQLIKLFLVKEEEDSYIVQERYKGYLDKIIDAELFFEYQTDKENYDFYTVDQLDCFIKSSYKKLKIKKLVKEITSYIDKKEKIPDYVEKLKVIYHHLQNGTLTKELTSPFYNEILNEQQNSYVSRQRSYMIHQLVTKTLPLTKKKEENLKTGICLLEKLESLEHRDYDNLGVTREYLQAECLKVHTRLSFTKRLQRTYLLTEEDYQYLDSLFLEGQLTKEKVKDRYPKFDKRQCNMICNKYRQILLGLIEQTETEKDYKIRVNVGYRVSHVKFYDFNTHYANVIDFISCLDDKEIDTLLNQYEKVAPLFKLLPLVDLISEFSMEDFKRIVLHYPRIEETFVAKGIPLKASSFNMVMDHFATVLRLSKIHVSVNPYVVAVLKEEGVEKIIHSEGDLNSYINAYFGMLKRGINTIAPIHGEYQNYVYESGNIDSERLFIGLNCLNSCINPNEPGEEAYNQALTKKNSDVIVIKDKNTNQFVARTLLFRRNNYIVMAPIRGVEGRRNLTFYHKDFLSKISNQLLSSAKEANDCLEYIFLTAYDEKLKDFPLIRNERLENGFPHSDLERTAYLIGSLYEKEEQPNLKKRMVSPVALYSSRREKLRVKSSNYQEDIRRIKALEIISEKHPKQKESLIEEFHSLSDANFDEVYIGQDWYIALKDNHLLSKGIFKTSDIRQQEEMRAVEENLLFNNKNSIDCKKEENLFPKIKRKK